MNALALVLNGSTRSSTLELFFAWVLAHVTQYFPLFVFAMGVPPGRRPRPERERGSNPHSPSPPRPVKRVAGMVVPEPAINVPPLTPSIKRTRTVRGQG